MEYGIPIPPREFAIVMDAIPTGKIFALLSLVSLPPSFPFVLNMYCLVSSITPLVKQTNILL